MSGVRFAPINESLGEPEQDANSALTELDKGLRSGKVGEQCEAIVRFPRLFEKYPFPILINSSFLKLADIFRVGNNFLRLWVLRVCQQSEKHLDKILNVDEFIKRVFSVIHSNDPVARALTLQTLGSVAGVIPERQQVHHSIRRSLDSHDSVEVEAAIYAAMQFAAQSKSFALGMCNKISDMIRGLATPAHMKLQLIPILQHMHHDTSTAAMVRTVCTDLLPKYPAKDFVVTTLNTLTKLAAATLVDIPSQVELLLDFLVKDKRWAVKKASLTGLHQLAKVGPHLWPQTCVTKTIHLARNSHHEAVISHALDIFIILTKSPVICQEYVDPDSELMKLCQETCYSSNWLISAKSVKILTNMVNFCFQEGLPISDVEEHLSTVESLLLLLVTCNKGDIEKYVLTSCLQSAVTLCKVHKPLANRFIELIASQLENASEESSLLLCQALGGIGSLEPGVLEPYLCDLTKKIQEICISSISDHISTKVMLCTIIFQTVRPSNWDEELQSSVDLVIENSDLWANYKVARAAARYGHFRVCNNIIKKLQGKVSSEHFHFWLIALQHISNAEASLKNEGSQIDRLENAITYYNAGITSLRAGSSPINSLSFQAEYSSLRCELLNCFSQLVSCCNSICFSPPPAIAVAIVTAARDELQRCGHITNQLRKCAKEFRACGELYWKLYQSAFDADQGSLTNLQILQHMCMLMAHSIDCVALVNYQGDEPSLDSSLQDCNLETTIMLEACKEASKFIQPMELPKTIVHQSVENLLEQVEILITSTFCMPRYFFQVLQSTSVKLAVTPQPRANGEYITVTSGQQLAVKVEGVIQHGSRAGLFRSVERVTITLTTHPSPRPNSNEKVNENGLLLTQTVIPHRDFFSAQFLVSLGSGSVQATVNVSASVIDQTGTTWQTGPKSTLTIKQLEDPAVRTH
ncbi:integrator complex subunit 7 [Halyomorpha halys]|uniref:integrator complex subunit 7 n=1 Tax=Halyomorpha halys TaxID=286706 RepID=UPI0006D502E9|nr:integrator complex subunit 7 [Halyomorpha halys]